MAETLVGRVSRIEYEESLRELHAMLPGAIVWIEQVKEKILPLFDEQS